MRILGVCSYNGKNYYGWQKQIDFISVEQVIEETLSKIYDQPIDIYAAGRTDAGTHALKQYFHFNSDKQKDLGQLRYAMNLLLPDDIKILSFKEVDDEFHARYSARKKIYQYRIVLDNKDPFMFDRAYLYPMDFDFNLFKEALNLFNGKHCFQDFTSKEEDEDGFVREVYQIGIAKKDNEILVTFEGNGFMRYQIRYMIGAAMAIANKKENMDYIVSHLDNNKKRLITCYKAPASGLFLADVIY